MIENKDYGLLEDAIALDIMKVVCQQGAYGERILLPYRKRYIELDKYVREEVQRDIARMKVIGKGIQQLDGTLVGSRLLENYEIKYRSVGDELLLAVEVEGGSLSYLVDSSGKFKHCEYSLLRKWEFIELINEYYDKCYEDGIFVDEDDFVFLCNDFIIYRGMSLYDLIISIYDVFRTKFNIGFVKHDTYFSGVDSTKIKVNRDTVVVKFLDGSEEYLIFYTKDTYDEIVGNYYVSKDIEWLSEEVRNKYFGKEYLGKVYFAKNLC
jgi:hypothetical protein